MPQRVLLVDDDANLRLITQICLEDVGNFEVRVADSGAQALEFAGQESFDVILLDVMMPHMDGIETYRRLKEAGCTAPVVFLTAKIQHHEMADYLKLGANGILSKPFDPMTLPDKVRKFMTQEPEANFSA